MAKRSLQTTQKDVANCDHLPQLSVESRILTIRDVQVILDRDLAELYGVQTARLNEQVKRNSRRFPEAFRFQLNRQETDELIANCDRFKTLKHSSFCPYAFTEQGVAMLSAVLHSDTAVDISIRIMNAFVAMRHFLLANAQVFQRLDRMELKQLETDHKIEQIFDKLEEQSVIPKQNIFFDGQIFDAYRFVAGLIKSAKKEIVLIDNYADETVLTMLDKRGPSVKATIYTKQVSAQFQLDINRHNAQYPPIEVQAFNKAHDRFLIIDEKVYHIGASLKDLGKKWFAFSLMQDITPQDLISRI
ncbi:MAG: ORF6N domain-containing protein [Bacteroidales bacterium]|nr:ORF6N domain-containing protein [Bacteroidales bacterium]